MDTLREKKIQKLQEKINKYDTILANRELLEKETNKDYKKKKRKMVMLSVFYAGFIIALEKFFGFGFPFVQEQIKAYKSIQTTIDENGNKVCENIEYNCLDYGELSSVVTSLGSYLYYYSNWNLTSSGEYIRYIEKYNLKDMSLEEVSNLLIQPEKDLSYIKDSLEIIKQTEDSKQDINELPHYEAVYNELDKQDYIFVRESEVLNKCSTALFGLFFVVSNVLLLAADPYDLKGYKKNFNQKVEKKEEEYRKKAQLELRRILVKKRKIGNNIEDDENK